MESPLLSQLDFDPAYILIALVLIQLILFVLLVSVNMKYNRLRKNYSMFMRGKDGKSLESSILARFDELDELSDVSHKNSNDIRDIYKKMSTNYQKIGIVKYDAFLEMGGNLSFALTMLDENNNGWIMNVMHSRDGCYTYVKEVVKGESFIELAEEESESLERAIYQEAYDLRGDKNVRY